jgi:exodeoxyribonuclease VII small subunit
VADTESTPNFEQALESLETIVGELEEGQIGLAESLAKYEQGIGLLKQCYQLLARVERRIELLSHADPRGEAITETFDDSPTAIEATSTNAPAARSRRRSRPQEATKLANEAATDMPPPATNAMDLPRSLF